MARSSYQYTCDLVEKKFQSTLSKPSIGAITNGDLSNHVISMELNNEKDNAVDSLTLVLRTDPAGTFIRSGPILTDENTKFKYRIDAKITQGSNSSKLFRFDISTVTILEDESNGEVIRITGRGIEYVLKETLDSEQIYFKTPKSAFRQRLFNQQNIYFPQGNVTIDSVDYWQGSTLQYADADIDLPDDHVIKNSWRSTGPTPVYNGLNSIIRTLAQPAVTGGTLDDYFWDTNNHATTNYAFSVFAKKFGVDASAGGLVTIDPTDIGMAEQKGKDWSTDNEVFKNLIIVRGASGSATLPMDHCRFRSDFQHARNRPSWSSSVTYPNYSLVKHKRSSDTNARFYKAIQGGQGFEPSTSAGASYWSEDVTITASQLNPWLIDRKDQIRSLGAHNYDQSLFESSSGADDGYVGFVPDWNLVRGNYDRDFDDEFGHVTLKWVTRVSNTPPTNASGELYHGQRILVGTSGSGAFNGKDNKIAQYDMYPDTNADTYKSSGSPLWRFATPVEGDLVNNFDTGETERFDGTDWDTPAWSIQENPPTTVSPTSAGSAGEIASWHLVKDIQTVEGATKGVNSATEWTYDWDVLGNARNSNSRGAWWYMSFPYPRINDSSATNKIAGSLYENGSRGTLDLENLGFSSNGLKGWNHGRESEDLGRITGCSFKFKLSVYHKRAGTGNLELVPSGFHNTDWTMWFMDMFDRVAYAKFKIRRNGGWEFKKVKLPADKLHYNRLNEFSGFYGYDMGDFFIPEKEYTGVFFDWRFIKAVGIQWDSSYASGKIGQYIGWQGAFAKDLTTTALEWASALFPVVDQAGQIAKMFDPALYDIDKVKITIDEFKFEKDMYVTSDPATTSTLQGSIKGARMHLEDKQGIQDYNTAKRIAEGKELRLEFFPQFYNVQSFGDVRVRCGDRVRIKGKKIPSTTLDGGVPYFDCGVTQVKHIIDHQSYRMQIQAMRKFIA